VSPSSRAVTSRSTAAPASSRRVRSEVVT